MKWIDRAVGRLGWVRKSRVARVSRAYAASAIDRLTAGWVTQTTTGDANLTTGLRIMRARSRQLVMDNDYAKKYVKMVVTNVVGSNGITLQSKAKDLNGDLDSTANAMIEREFGKWGRLGVCTMDGQHSWKGLQRLFIETMARDGEAIIRLVRGADNPYEFAVQTIEADHLDENYNTTLPNGNKISMSVEKDQWSRPVAYHLTAEHPGDGIYGYDGALRKKVPAEEIIHAFVKDRPTQSRGVPWMHTAMARINMLGGYEEAELVAARSAACKMGFLEDPDQSYTADDTDDKGNLISETEPGLIEKLPAGVKFTSYDPQHPTGTYPSFMKIMLRGIASGLNVSYNSLASDLEGVNFSSIRTGVLEERHNWRVIQGWMIEVFCQPIFEAWLEMAMLTGALPLPVAKFNKFNAVRWQGRGWDWVDPLKDQKANAESVALGVKTRSMIVSEQGSDLEDIFEQLKTEKELAATYGLNFETVPAAPGKEGPENGKTDD